ncbi:MAG: Mfa1 family fimbria major subunit [Parabacteroides sp.]|nr:Mfa1 family fimbria major subunit [Parabacteroides sp.]
MKMTLFKQGMLLMALLGGVSSCINDDVPAGTHEVGKDDPDGNVVFEMIVPNNTGTLTKAETTETSGVYETGSVDEYKVHNVTVFLFDAQTGAFRQSFYLSDLDLVSGSPSIGGSQTDTDKATSDQSQHQVCYQSRTLKVEEEGSYNIYAVANKAYAQPTNETEFLNSIDNSSYNTGWINLDTSKGFIMTTRADNSGLYASNLTGTNRNVQLVKKLTTAEPTRVKLVLERVVAKVLVGRSADQFQLTKQDGTQSVYATVSLTDYSPLNLSTQFYRHRHVANFSGFPTSIPTNVTANFGEVTGTNGYVVDPYFLNKTVEGAANFTNPDGYYARPLGGTLNWNQINTSTFSYFYCLENCMFQTAQKNAYSTGVHFRARLIPTLITTVGGSTSTSTNSSVLYYANYTFFDSWDALKERIDVSNAGVSDGSTDQELARVGIKRFKRESNGNFYCYYNYWIRHLDNNDPTTMGVMEFAIVRNNIYRLLVSGINDLGSGSPEVVPGQDDEYGVKLEISFCVLPWIVRNQGGNAGVIL